VNLQMHPLYGRRLGESRMKVCVPYHRGNSMTMIGAVSINKVEEVFYGD